jgi:hypothetical protein
MSEAAFARQTPSAMSDWTTIELPHDEEKSRVRGTHSKDSTRHILFPDWLTPSQQSAAAAAQIGVRILATAS